MAKANKETVFLVATSGSGFFYCKRRNKKKGKGESKLSLKKYDPVARCHVAFGEKKLSSLKKKFKREKFIEAQESAASKG